MAWSLDSMWNGTTLGAPDGGYSARSAQAAANMAAAQQQSAMQYGAVDEARRRTQEESDRQYQLQVKQIKQQAEQIAIQKGQAKANEWYQKQMVNLAKDKFEQEKYQFQVTASGYMGDGSNTLARDQFQDNSLQNWTKYAIDLGSRPEDWVKYKRMTSGVAENIGSIPGLSWTVGGQQGAQTFQGEPRSNSLGNVLTAIGIGQGMVRPGGSNWADQAAGQAAAGQVAMTPDEQSIYQTANEFAKNPQGAAPGWWDNLDTDTRDMIKGAAEAQGHSWSSVMSRYGRSRWGGGGSSVAA